MRRATTACLALLVALGLPGAPGVLAQTRTPSTKSEAPAQKTPAPKSPGPSGSASPSGGAGPGAAGSTPNEANVPYEPSLLRLAEIMGALAYLRDLCGIRDGEDWRAKMSTLIEAEGVTQGRRERLAGAFNRGFRGYETTYRSCTDNARVIISRYLDEGSRIARDVSNRFGGG